MFSNDFLWEQNRLRQTDFPRRLADHSCSSTLTSHESRIPFFRARRVPAHIHLRDVASWCAVRAGTDLFSPSRLEPMSANRLPQDLAAPFVAPQPHWAQTGRSFLVSFFFFFASSAGPCFLHRRPARLPPQRLARPAKTPTQKHQINPGEPMAISKRPSAVGTCGYSRGRFAAAALLCGPAPAPA